VAQWLIKGGFYIGCHQYIDEAAIQYVTDKFCESSKIRDASGLRSVAA